MTIQDCLNKAFTPVISNWEYSPLNSFYLDLGFRIRSFFDTRELSTEFGNGYLCCMSIKKL